MKIGLGILAGLIMAAPAVAAPISFDCDVPADHFSSVKANVAGAARISGTVTLVEARRGNNLPVAGARLMNGQKQSVGFQLVLTSANRDEFDIVLNGNDGSGLNRVTVGQVHLIEPTPFELVVGPDGEAKLTIGGRTFSAKAVPLADVEAMAFCSTGQFKFGDLMFGS